MTIDNSQDWYEAIKSGLGDKVTLQAAAIKQAERRGAERMRERAWRVLNDNKFFPGRLPLMDRILALPLSDDEGVKE